MSAKGILGRKLGMTQIWDDEHRVVPVTVIEAGPCRVVQLKTPERDGYSAVQLAFGDTKPQRLSKPELGPPQEGGCAGPAPPRRAPGRRSQRLRGRPGHRRRRLRRRRAGRRHRHQQGQGLLRGDAAPQLQGPGRVARQPQEAPLAGFGRRVRDARPRVQGHEDGGPVRQRPHHHAEPRGGRGRRRARHPPRQGRGARPQRRPRVREERGEAPGGAGRAEGGAA